MITIPTSTPDVIFMRWEHPTKARYYEARLALDLLNDLVLCCYWGSQYSRLGGRAQTVCTSYEAALTELKALHRRRLQHGYSLIQQASLTFTESQEIIISS